ncbi:ABC transporter substrate-binding protein, partial [Escherichia coli]
DDEGKPAVGVRRVQEAASSDGMRFFLGAYSSAVGLAESEVAQREKLLQYAAGGSEDFTGSRCGRYTFQWSAHPYTA